MKSIIKETLIIIAVTLLTAAATKLLITDATFCAELWIYELAVAYFVSIISVLKYG